MVANANRAKLFDLFPATVNRGETKAIRSHHHTCVQDAMFTDGAIHTNGDICFQPRASTNACTLFNHTQGANAGAWVNDRFGVHHGAWMNQGFAIFSDLLLAPQLGHFGEIQIRIRGNNKSRASTDQ